MLKSFAILAVAVTAMLAAPVASPQQTPKGWLSEDRLANSIERDGFRWAGRHQDVHTSSCLGLRRYGARRPAVKPSTPLPVRHQDRRSVVLAARDSREPDKTWTSLSASMF
jgi:hypothetical protein